MSDPDDLKEEAAYESWRRRGGQTKQEDELNEWLRDNGYPEVGSTPWQIICRDHGKVPLTEENYRTQLSNANARWKCPVCGATVAFDDANYEKHYPMEDEPEDEEGDYSIFAPDE